ncbi:MAG: hypothetical protein AAF517_07420 [Planctomycetota bacterium]
MFPLLLAASPLDSFGRHTAETGPLYSHASWTPARVEWAKKRLPVALKSVEARLGRKFGGKFTTILAGDFRDFEQLATAYGARRVGDTTRGIAFPGRRTIIVRGDRYIDDLPGDPVSRTLSHEIAHLVIHHGAKGEIPKWLDEGAAVWASKGAISPKSAAELGFLARTGGLYHFQTLEDSFPQGHYPTSIAYQQSYLIVEFLVEEYGDDVVAKFLEKLRPNATSAEIFLEVSGGETLKEFEKRFSPWVIGRYSAFGIIGVILSNPWVLVSLLAVLAILRSIWKRRRLMKRLEAEEERYFARHPEERPIRPDSGESPPDGTASA